MKISPFLNLCLEGILYMQIKIPSIYEEISIDVANFWFAFKEKKSAVKK